MPFILLSPAIILHNSLSCIFTSLGRMCKLALRSLIVKIPFFQYVKERVSKRRAKLA